MSREQKGRMKRYLWVTKAAINAVLAQDHGFGPLQLELPAHHVEHKGLPPFQKTGELEANGSTLSITTHTKQTCGVPWRAENNPKGWDVNRRPQDTLLPAAPSCYPRLIFYSCVHHNMQVCTFSWKSTVTLNNFLNYFLINGSSFCSYSQLRTSF